MKSIVECWGNFFMGEKSILYAHQDFAIFIIFVI